MASANANLHKAKDAKNDEFYTQLTDVSKEMMHYKQHFKNKIVFCNCDDPTWSAFWKYFHLNFSVLGLKKLISTHYDREEATYKMEYTGGDDNNIEVGVKTPLEGNGDFRNQECLDLLDEADIVVTNPPFSLFREYVSALMKHKKKFLIIGNKNAITYKDFFPLLKNDDVWTGCTGVKEFLQPDGSIKKFGNIGWFTNLDVAKRHEKLILWKKYTPEEYPKYDNYDAINVNKIADIPVDYNGVMGVPISIMDKYNPEQFEIVSFRKGNDGRNLVFTRESEREFNRTFVSLYDLDSRDDKKRRRQNQWEAYLRENNNQTEIEPIDFFYPVSWQMSGKDRASITGKLTYARVFVCKKAGVR